MDLRPQTPGPWSVDNYGAEPAIRTDGGMAIVPRVFGTLADARLMAAAPDLLAACAWARDRLRQAGMYWEGPDPLDAAIAKARGETP